MRQVFGIVRYNFFGFLRNPKVIFIFLLEFVLSFLLTGRIMVVMETYDTPVQAIEPFIWTFGDGIGLDPDMKKPVGKYSLGMRQRLGIAQAIMEDPLFLILDEPFNGLDKHGVEEIRELLLDLKTAGKTILLASHNEEDIRILCDHVYEMDGGILRERTA